MPLRKRDVDPLERCSLDLLADIRRDVDTKVFSICGLSRRFLIPESDIEARIHWLCQKAYVVAEGHGIYSLQKRCEPPE